jgi:hypothetical protein
MIDTETLLRLASGLRNAETLWRQMDGLHDPDDGAVAPEVDMMDGWVDGYAAAIASVVGGVTGAEVRAIAREESNPHPLGAVERAACDVRIATRITQRFM